MPVTPSIPWKRRQDFRDFLLSYGIIHNPAFHRRVESGPPIRPMRDRPTARVLPNPGHPQSGQLLNHRVKQLVELFRMTRPALQDLCVTLWPAEAMPKSLFGLTAHLQNVVPCVERWKRSACFEGARRAYACVKTHFRKVDAETCAAGPPADKPRTAE